MENPNELLVREVFNGDKQQVKIIMLAIAVYEMIVLGKKVLSIAGSIKL